MSDFWSTRTGASPTPRAPQPQYAPQFQPQQAPNQQFMPQQPGQQFQPMQAPPGQMVAPSVYMDGWGRQFYVSQKSDRHVESCPNCSSANYGKADPNSMAKSRCYDCGYPVVQYGSDSGSGSYGPRVAGAAAPARQVPGAGADGGWNPSGFSQGVGIIQHL